MSELPQQPVKKKRSIGVIVFGVYFISTGLNFISVPITFENSVRVVRKQAIHASQIMSKQIEGKAFKIYKNDSVKKEEVLKNVGSVKEDALSFLNAPLSFLFFAAKTAMNLTAFLFLLTGILVLMLRPVGRILAILTTAVSWVWVVFLNQFILLDIEAMNTHLSQFSILANQILGKVPVPMHLSMAQESLILVAAGFISGLLLFLITWWFFTRPKVKEQFNQ